jgi:uncharacterized protein (TIGR02594 family)
MKECIIETALQEFGVAEIVGKQHNPRIVEYFKDIGHEWVIDDETAWCSAFANWVAKQCGYHMSDKLNARSWLTVGKSTDTPEKGDVVVFWRGSKSDWRGHVAFFIRETKNYIYVLGGNQGNKVSIQAYTKNRLLQYRDIS